MIPDGYFPTAESLVTQVKGSYEMEAWRVGIVTFHTEYAFRFDNWSKDELGPYVTTSLPELWFTKNYKAALPKPKVDSLFVYCDILEHVPVGDGLAPLLRAVVVRGKHGDRIGERFVDPMYLPIQKKKFGSIEINIMTDTGSPVPFIDWRSMVLLHFRRSNNPYFLQK